jgi:hypothetical protein
MAYVNIEVDVDDVLYALSHREKIKLANDLFDEGYYQTELERKLNPNPTPSINEQLFHAEMDKIYNNYLNLTSEEEELIFRIAKRF